MNVMTRGIIISTLAVALVVIPNINDAAYGADLVVYSTSSPYANSNDPHILSIYAYVDQYWGSSMAGNQHTSAYWPYWGNNWYQSSFTVEYGYSMTLTNVYFENESGTGGPTNYSVCCQANGGAITSISGGIQTMPRDGLWHTNIANNAGVPITGLTGTVFILIYGGYAVGYSTISSTGQYEWRHRNIRIQGTVTQLPIAPAQAATPSPATNTTVHKDLTLSWRNEGGSAGYKVYVGISSNLSPGNLKINTSSNSYIPGFLDYGTKYYWRVDATNAYGVTTGNVWSFNTGSPVSTAIDATQLVWSAGGSALWFGQTNITHDTNSAAQSGSISYSSTSSVSTVVSGPGILTFWWKVSSYQYNHYLRFSIDAQQVSSISGESTWQSVSNKIGSGDHTVMWAYTKNNYGPPAGLDAGWLDQVVWVTNTAHGTPYQWLDQYSLVTGGNYEAADALDTDGDGYAAWQEYIAGTVPTNRASVFKALVSISNRLPRVAWTPDLGTGRIYTVEGRKNLTGGSWGTSNAASRFFRVKVAMGKSP